MPRYLGYRGERLGFSNGIILLTVSAGFLIWFFNGNVEHLISLYAIGVFLSFTITQLGLTVSSPFRLVIQPIMDFIDKQERDKRPEDYITGLIPEFETEKWWHRFLHSVPLEKIDRIG